MAHNNGFLSVMAAVMAPYLRGSPAFLVPQIPQSHLSPLEAQVLKSDRHNLGRNSCSDFYSPPVMVLFHRGILQESKKDPASHSQRIHGYRTPRYSYRKVAEHR